MKVSVSRIAEDVATLLGESLAQECQTSESPFPDIAKRVGILVPQALAEVSTHPQHLRPYRVPDSEGFIDIPENLYTSLLLKLKKLIVN